jgi:hypothetical protein
MLSSGLFTGVCNLSTVPSFRNTLSVVPSMKVEQRCSETLTFTLQTPVNNPEGGIQHAEHGESFKSRVKILAIFMFVL